MKTALCIVDMQYRFPAYEQVEKEVLREIKLAKKRNASIVLLEFGPNGGDSIEAIYKALDSYPNTIKAIKNRNNGSNEFAAAIEGLDATAKVRVCGVNGCACVEATVEGLIQLGFKVETVAKAIGCVEHCHNRNHIYNEARSI